MARLHDVSDAEILAMARREPSVFEVLFDRHFDTILRYATTRVGPDHSGDVAAETFVRAFDKRSSYDVRRDSALPWLFGIASNVCKEMNRKMVRGHRAWLRSIGSADHWTTSFDTDAASRVDARARREDLEAALGRLSHDEYLVLILATVVELSYQEIADTLDIPVGTVRSRLARARRRVRELLTPVRSIPDGSQSVVGVDR